MQWILAAAMMVAPAQAMAAPVYLTCDMVNDGKAFTIDWALNEDNQTATILGKDGKSPTTGLATFSSDKVEISTEPFTWTIDRVSLRIVRDIHLSEVSREGEGKCTVAKPPANRAF